jgi:penicillin amidase
MKNKIKYIWLLITVLLVSSACFAQTPTETLSVTGLKDSVTVRRDERGIAHIEAKNETDLYFAQGYVTASDRLWQMDLYRRVARGETAEIFGKTILEEDKRWRKFGFARIAEEAARNSTGENRQALENYARGVNAYIASLSEKSLPVEFQILQYHPREWTTADSLVVGKIFDDALSNTWRMDLMKANLMNLPKEKLDWIFDPSSPLDVLLVGKDSENSKSQVAVYEPSGAPLVNWNPALLARLNEIEKARQTSLERIGFHAEDLAASNNWVVSGKRTVDGKSLLANDPHLRPAQPPIWYLIHLSAPNLNVAGVSTAGIPGVILGHNEQIAWGATNVGPDVQDLYVETFDAGGKYKTPNGWESPTIRQEEIKIRKILSRRKLKPKLWKSSRRATA